MPQTRLHVPIRKVGYAMNRVIAKLKAELMVMSTTKRREMAALVVANSVEKMLMKARRDQLALKP